MRYWKVFVFCIVFVSYLNGQPPVTTYPRCDNSNSNKNPDYTNYYKRIETYIPDEEAPVKHIRIAVNVFTNEKTIQKSDTTIEAIKQMVRWLNDYYTYVDSATYPIDGVPWLKDTKIRFDLNDRIYFYDSTTLNKSTSIATLEKHVASVDSSRLNNLNIYITYPGKATPYSLSPYPNFILKMNGGLSYAKLDGSLAVYFSSNRIVHPNSITLAHEIGHCLDLLHTYEPSCCHETCDASDPDYLYDLFGTNPPAYCWERGHWACEITPGENTCTNNIMGGNSRVNWYFSPMQIGKIHRALSIKTSRKYVDDVFDTRPMEIRKNELWNFDIRCYSSIIVHKGATLTITGKVQLPQQASITVSRGAKLIIDGGAITGSANGWQGIEAKKSKNALQRLFGKNAQVEIINGAYVQVAGTN